MGWPWGEREAAFQLKIERPHPVSWQLWGLREASEIMIA